MTYSKKDSEEICFVQNRDHGLFIKQRNPELIKEGYFIDEKGEKLGKHNGIVYYTVGQRKRSWYCSWKESFLCQK